MSFERSDGGTTAAIFFRVSARRELAKRGFTALFSGAGGGDRTRRNS
jgi:hypothetical protein